MRYSQKILLALVTSFGLLFAHNGFAYTVEITEQQLQEKLNAKTFKHEDSLIKAEVTSSKIRLIDEGDKVELSAAVKILVLKQIEGLGNMSVQGRIEYMPEKGEFYFRDATITALTIDQIAPEYLPLIQQALQKTITKALQERPIYVLDDNDMKQKLAKSRLNSVIVKDKTLVFDFSIF